MAKTYSTIGFWDIQKNDTLSVERTFGDGTTCSLKGVAKYKGENGNWLTAEGLAIALDPKNRRFKEHTVIQRKDLTQIEKDALFEFPQHVGAKVKVYHMADEKDLILLFNGRVWVETFSNMPRRYSEPGLRQLSSNLRVWH